MQLLKNKFISRSFWMILFTFCNTSLFAQNEAAPQKTNLLEVMMMMVAIVLAFVIWGLSRILMALGKEIVKTSKQSSAKILSIVLIITLSLSSGLVRAQDVAVAAEETSYINYGGLSATEFWMLASVIGIEVLAILFMSLAIRSFYKTLKPSPVKEKVQSEKWKALWHRFDKKFLTRAIPVEKEADVLLDHNYDGIRELDNALPPWWKYGFILTIICAFIYLFNFHVMGTGKNPLQEYQSEMKNAEQQIAAYNDQNKDKVDEKNVVMLDASGIAAGKAIFSQTCFPCHGKSGEGSVGPNLTDSTWLHGGSLNDIYHTIKVGYPDKGMQGWAAQFSPKQINQITSYIKAIKGSNPPNAKAPQGDIYEEIINDSISVKPHSADSSVVK